MRRDLAELDIATAYGHCKGLCHYAPVVHIDSQCLAEATIPDLLARLGRNGCD
ncbi:hypothetical protein [Mariprofundus erugo]|uniref:hypothetical protein n=1 Tax=Mariprofundus erugo TaxID=2528639 RepID=UPI0013754723|nr:hypothetical protein [Mariprofundus erugo]